MNLKKINIIGAIFVIALGTLLHFAYDWSGESDFVAIFGAVNESTWEHLKLLFFPVLLFSVVEYFVYGKNVKGFWASKTIALMVGMLTIIAVFYTYTGVLGENVDVVNIMLFVTASVLVYYLSYNFMNLEMFENSLLNKVCVLVLVGVFIMFWVYTFYPPLINLFKDPITSGFGI